MTKIMKLGVFSLFLLPLLILLSFLIPALAGPLGILVLANLAILIGIGVIALPQML